MEKQKKYEYGTGALNSFDKNDLARKIAKMAKAVEAGSYSSGVDGKGEAKSMAKKEPELLTEAQETEITAFFQTLREKEIKIPLDITEERMTKWFRKVAA